MDVAPDSAIRSRQRTILLYEGDDALITYIKQFLGMSSESEVIRSALRAYAMHLETISRNRKQ